MNMWIKSFLTVCLLLPFIVSAQTGKNAGQKSGSTQKKSSTAVAGKKTEAKAKVLTKKEKEALLREISMNAASFNPGKPGLTQERVKKVMLDEVYDKLLNKKIPEEIGKIKKSADTITYLGTRMVLFHYDILLKNPELPEVTAVPVSWYKEYGEKLKKFEALARTLDQAVSAGNAAAYGKARAQIIAYQKVVTDFAESRKGKLSSDEMRELRKKNTLWRQAQFRKNQEELLKKAGISPEQAKELTSKKSSAKKTEKAVKKTQKKSNTSSSSSGSRKNKKKSNSRRYRR